MCSAACVSLAKPKSDAYQIELIMFKQNNTAADIYKERWPAAKLAIPNDFNTLVINAANNPYTAITKADTNSYTLLPKDKLKYSSIYNKIKYSKRYSAINHIGWQQPKKELSHSKPIYFTTGQTYFYNNASTQEISGIIKFSTKRFVHAKLDLLLNLPVKTEQSLSKQFELVQNFDGNFTNNMFLQSFLLSEDRRLKNNELNYFDHPVFSAILVVSEV